MLYFADLAVPRKEIDSDQIKKVDEFRAEREKGSLCWTYDSYPAFQIDLSRYLDLQIPRWFPEEYTRDQPSISKTEHKVKLIQLDAQKYKNKLCQELNTISLLGSSVLQPFPLQLKDIFVSLEMYDGARVDRASRGGIFASYASVVKTYPADGLRRDPKQVYFDVNQPSPENENY